MNPYSDVRKASAYIRRHGVYYYLLHHVKPSFRKLQNEAEARLMALEIRKAVGLQAKSSEYFTDEDCLKIFQHIGFDNLQDP